jgi:hypothetical protein
VTVEVSEVVGEEVIGEAVEVSSRQRWEHRPDRVGVAVNRGQPEVDQPAQRADQLRAPSSAAAQAERATESVELDLEAFGVRVEPGGYAARGEAAAQVIRAEQLGIAVANPNTCGTHHDVTDRATDDDLLDSDTDQLDFDSELAGFNTSTNGSTT